MIVLIKNALESDIKRFDTGKLLVVLKSGVYKFSIDENDKPIFEFKRPPIKSVTESTEYEIMIEHYLK